MIDLSQYPVLDHHCHAFIPEKEMERGISFAQSFHLTQAPEQENENLILYKRVIIELARVLECGSKKPSDIIAQRNKAYPHGNREKQIEYITKLFDDAKIAWLFFDTGFPTSESLDSYDADAESLGSTFMKQKFKFIFRFEQLMWRLFNQSLPFDDMLDEYSSALTKAVKQEGYIGFKSAIAYRYGLDVHDHDIESARKAYEELREKNLLTIPYEERELKYPKVIYNEKVLRDFLTCRGIEKSIELDVPLQVHTGTGLAPIINATKCNPILLYDILKDPKLGRAKFVLVHMGYPYVEETAWLANSFCNVYVDMSFIIPYIHFGIKERVLQIMEWTPMNKIIYGSDGAYVPEIYWLGAILGKDGISKALQDLVISGFIDEDYAYKVGSWILSENAKRLYKVKF